MTTSLKDIFTDEPFFWWAYKNYTNPLYPVSFTMEPIYKDLPQPCRLTLLYATTNFTDSRFMYTIDSTDAKNYILKDFSQHKIASLSAQYWISSKQTFYLPDGSTLTRVQPPEPTSLEGIFGYEPLYWWTYKNYTNPVVSVTMEPIYKNVPQPCSLTLLYATTNYIDSRLMYKINTTDPKKYLLIDSFDKSIASLSTKYWNSSNQTFHLPEGGTLTRVAPQL